MIENNDERLLTNDNPIRERMKKRNATDFSSSSLRRIALTQLGRKR
ncbi:hypothetical protein ACFSFW_05185 [Fredinandcohnia salidurans]|uniref:Uncharacterized protein n=1 Tax=Fredinandcohnia salidurans TaxID=2595041 RepID=A0ABW4MJI8_9BACI|nr:hypothetical protein [Fredinandcohnia onubensis]